MKTLILKKKSVITMPFTRPDQRFAKAKPGQSVAKYDKATKYKQFRTVKKTTYIKRRV